MTPPSPSTARSSAMTHIILADLVGLAVERLELLALAPKPRADGALELVGVVDMQGAAAVVGDVIGDIDQRVDGTEADRLQPPLQPVRAWPVLDAPDHPAREHRAGSRALLVELELDRDRIGEGAVDRLDRVGLERAEAGGGEVAGNAAHAETIRPVGRDGDLDHRIVETERLRSRAADLGVGGKLDDAAMLVRQLKLALREQHAVRFHAPDLGLGEGEIAARHIGCPPARTRPSARRARWARRRRLAGAPCRYRPRTLAACRRSGASRI